MPGVARERSAAAQGRGLLAGALLFALRFHARPFAPQARHRVIDGVRLVAPRHPGFALALASLAGPVTASFLLANRLFESGGEGSIVLQAQRIDCARLCPPRAETEGVLLPSTPQLVQLLLAFEQGRPDARNDRAGVALAGISDFLNWPEAIGSCPRLSSLLRRL